MKCLHLVPVVPQPCISLATFLERVLHLVDLQQLCTRGVSTAPRVWATKKHRRAAGGGRDPGSGVADVHMHAIAIHEDLQSGAAVALGYGPEVSRGGGEGRGAAKSASGGRWRRRRRRPMNRGAGSRAPAEKAGIGQRRRRTRAEGTRRATTRDLTRRHLSYWARQPECGGNLS